MTRALHGIITPLVTPFDRSGEILEKGYQESIEFVIKNGVHGLVLLATAGESPCLTFAEKKRLIDLGLKTNSGRVPILVGVGGLNARETFQLIDYAEGAGADGLFVITPYFFRFTREEYIGYFVEISKRCKTQILIYNSTYAEVPLDPKSIARLAELPNITGLKEGNPMQTSEVIRLTGGRLGVFTSRDTYLYENMALGGAGGIFFSSNVAPKLSVELYDAMAKGNWARGREIQFKLNPLVLQLVARSYPAGIKAAMNLVGLTGGQVRFPLTDYTQDEVARLRRVLQEIELV